QSNLPSGGPHNPWRETPYHALRSLFSKGLEHHPAQASCGSRNQSNPIVKFHCQTVLDAIYSNRIYSSPSRSNASADETIQLVRYTRALLVVKVEHRQKLMN